MVWGNTISGVQQGVVVHLEDPGASLDAAGYPALDQTGNPKDFYIWGNSINSVGSPIYLDPTTNPPTSHSIGYCIQRQRDYHLIQKSG